MKASDKKYHHELPHPTPPRDISLAFTPLHDIYNCKMKRLNWGGVRVDKQDYFFLLFTKSGKSTYAVIDYTDTFWGKKSGRTYAMCLLSSHLNCQLTALSSFRKTAVPPSPPCSSSLVPSSLLPHLILLLAKATLFLTC